MQHLLFIKYHQVKFYMLQIMTSRTQNNSLTIGQKLQALSLIEHGITAKVVQAVTGVSIQSISYLKRKARDRGYDPTVSRILKVEYVQDAPRSGRPLKVTPEIEQAILNNVRHDRNSRENLQPFWDMNTEFHLQLSSMFFDAIIFVPAKLP